MELLSFGVLRSINRIQTLQIGLRHINKRCLYCSNAHRENASGLVERSTAAKSKSKTEVVSRAMKLYLERSQAYNKMMNTEIDEFEVGKRHLANIMGVDVENLSQKDIDQAIQYLLPSGLTDKKARPMMKHPLELFPNVKAAQFSMDGRPHHFLFYTGKPQYYQLMHDMASRWETMEEKQRRRLKAKINIIMDGKRLDLSGTEWIGVDEIRKLTEASVTVDDYRRFVVLGDRFAAHELSFLEEAFILKYRRLKPLQSQQSIPEVLETEDGREYQIAKAKRKKAIAEVAVYDSGNGQITINNQDLGYFSHVMEREQLFFPLQVAQKVGQVDIVAKVTGGGPMGQAGAIRLGISMALRNFVTPEIIEQMRLAGLLTRDPRVREKKKPGQPKARKKQTWKRR